MHNMIRAKAKCTESQNTYIIYYLLHYEENLYREFMSDLTDAFSLIALF